MGKCFNCVDGYFAAGGRCWQKGILVDRPAGSGCFRGAQCASGMCLGGVCCVADNLDAMEGRCGTCGLAGECIDCGYGCGDCLDWGSVEAACTECGLLYTLEGTKCEPFLSGRSLMATTYITAAVCYVGLLAISYLCTRPPSEPSAAAGPPAAAEATGKPEYGAGSFKAFLLLFATLDVISDLSALAFVMLLTDNNMVGLMQGILLVVAMCGGFGALVVPRVQLGQFPASRHMQQSATPTPAHAPKKGKNWCQRYGPAIACGCFLLYWVVFFILVLAGVVTDFMMSAVPFLAFALVLGVLMPPLLKSDRVIASFTGRPGFKPPPPAPAGVPKLPKVVGWVVMQGTDTAGVLEAALESLPQAMLQVAVLTTLQVATDGGAGTDLSLTPITLALSLSTLNLVTSYRLALFVPRSAILLIGLSLLAGADGALVLNSVATNWPMLADLVNYVTPLSAFTWWQQWGLYRVFVTCGCFGLGGTVVNLLRIYKGSIPWKKEWCNIAFSFLFFAPLIAFGAVVIWPITWMLSHICWTLPAILISAAYSNTRDQHAAVLGPQHWRIRTSVPLRRFMMVLFLLQVVVSGLMPWITLDDEAAGPQPAIVKVTAFLYFFCVGAGGVLTVLGIATASGGDFSVDRPPKPVQVDPLVVGPRGGNMARRR